MDEGGWGGTVESKFFLNDEGGVVGEGNLDEILADEECADVDEANGQIVIGITAGDDVEPLESLQHPESEQDHQGDDGLNDVKTGVDALIIAGFVQFLSIEKRF